MDLQTSVDELHKQNPDSHGFAVAIIDGDGSTHLASSGFAAPGQVPFTAHTPVRTASVTKTLVAAAMMRLYETERLDIDAPLAGLIDPSFDTLLRSGGFDTHTITPRHLAMHVAGLSDHFVSDVFMTRVFANPDYRWSRWEQLEILVETFEPLSQPGERYSYSDSGYLLLGQIIERITGASVSDAVRQLTKLNAIGLDKTWWDALDAPPQIGLQRAHQCRDGVDIHDFDGSMDAFGGGGWVASTLDMAVFFRALFSGQVFDKPGTLETMTSAPGHPQGSPYRIGLYAAELGGLQCYSHAGYWGTNAIAVPALGSAIAGTTLERATTKALNALLEEAVRFIANGR